MKHIKEMHDLVIIGGGVVGTLTAYYASQYKMRICLIEKNCDVGSGATKANSGIIHGGYDDKKGCVKAQFCRTGNRMYQGLSETLGFTVKWCGSLVVAFNEEERVQLHAMYHNGIHNGVEDTRIIEKAELREIEPEISHDATCALYCPSAGVVAPFEVAFAAAEHAVRCGVELRLQERVVGIHREHEHFNIETDRALYCARACVNAAGLFSDTVARMVGIQSPTITPRKGEYLVYDRSVKKNVNHIVFQTPTKAGKGILVTPTYAGNIMIGPNAVPTENREDCSVDIQRLKNIIQRAAKSIPFIAETDSSKVLRAYAGLRACSSTGDFVVDTVSVPRFISLVGIQSPGLTSAPALAKHALRCLEAQGLYLNQKETLPPRRVGIKNVPRNSYLSPRIAANEAQRSEGDLKRIVCRCEQVREETIRDALTRVVPLHSLDAVKRRTRAGMGACQGAFCAPRVRSLIADFYHRSKHTIIQESARNSQSIKSVLRKMLK